MLFEVGSPEWILFEILLKIHAQGDESHDTLRTTAWWV